MCNKTDQTEHLLGGSLQERGHQEYICPTNDSLACAPSFAGDGLGQIVWLFAQGAKQKSEAISHT